MKKKSICIFLTVVVLVVISVLLWRQFAPKEPEETRRAVLIPEEREDSSLVAEDPTPEIPVSQTVEDEKFYLVVEDGYLSVYRGKDTFYAYTDIRYDELDEATKAQIQSGLSFSDERSLYDFLENHSS